MCVWNENRISWEHFLRGLDYISSTHPKICRYEWQKASIARDLYCCCLYYRWNHLFDLNFVYDFFALLPWNDCKWNVQCVVCHDDWVFSSRVAGICWLLAQCVRIRLTFLFGFLLYVCEQSVHLHFNICSDTFDCSSRARCNRDRRVAFVFDEKGIIWEG